MESESRDDKSEKLPPHQAPIERLLRWGIDHPGITPSNPRIDLKTYVLAIGGEVEKPLKLSWSDITKLPKVESISDFHCVEGWSVLHCRWEGIRFAEVIKQVKPKQTAHFATFECADGYSTSLSLQELSDDNVLLAYGLDGKPLEEGYGFPLRLVVPSKYGYKNALWVTCIIFTVKKELGYWEKRGFSDTADVWKNERFSY